MSFDSGANFLAGLAFPKTDLTSTNLPRLASGLKQIHRFRPCWRLQRLKIAVVGLKVAVIGRVHMQIARLFSGAVGILGIGLLSIQLILDVAHKPFKVHTGPKRVVVDKTSWLPGVVGAGLLITGIVTFVTTRRKGGPPAKF